MNSLRHSILSFAILAGAGCSTDGSDGRDYADENAVAAMGAADAGNPLNHTRYSDAEAVAAVGTHTVDTTLDEAAVDAFVANNGFLTSESDPTVNALGNADLSACTNAQVAKYDSTTGLWQCADDDAGVSGSLAGADLNAMNMLTICTATNSALLPATSYYSYVAWAANTLSCAEACTAANPSTNYGGPVATGFRFLGSNSVTLASRIHHYTTLVAGGQLMFCCCRGGDNQPEVHCTPGAVGGCVVSPGNIP